MSAHALAALLGLTGCGFGSSFPPRAPGTRAQVPEQALEVIYDRGLASHWHDYGWAPRELVAGQPAKVDFSDQKGWIIANPEISGRYLALRFRLNSPVERGDFLDVHLDSPRADFFPRIHVAPKYRVDGSDGWSEVRMSLAELNPDNLPFDRVVLVGRPGAASGSVQLDGIALVRDLSNGLGPRPPAATNEARMAVHCSAPSQPISDMIYGIAVQAGNEGKDAYVAQLGVGARRWGGNPTSTYNWKVNAWNLGNDWYYDNASVAKDPGYSYRRVLDDDVSAGIKTALTVPVLGWVSKDNTSASFPVSAFGPQQSQDPYSEAGNGVGKGGSPLKPGPQTRTSLAEDPSFLGEWVAQIQKDDAQRGGKRSVDMYILDNEPGLWNSTHRDLHPDPVSYDELLDRTIRYGSAVRKADPQAVIAGPAEWGWPNYFASAVDGETHYKLNPDRLRHGNVPILAWLLRKLKEHQDETGEHILDVLDVHYYPMADRVGGSKGGTDSKTAALRLRSTRSLWDPSYTDESWIDDRVELIPRLKQWIAENDPGVDISIGEWNFGAEDHLSGGLAAAEALGRFGQQGIKSAFYWTYPPNNSPAFWAFRAFRNFDGQGGKFLGRSVPTTTVEDSSLFASRDEGGGHLVLVALNLSPDTALATKIDVGECGPITASRAFSYSAGKSELTASTVKASGATASATLEPYSITVFDLHVTPR